MTLEEARKFFSGDVYATDVTGITIESVAPNYAKCSLKLTPKHRNAVGQVMGGVLFTLADFAFAVATNVDPPLTVTAVSQISFLSAVKGDTITAETSLLKEGKRSCYYRIDIVDDTGALVAVVSSSGMHLDK